MAPSRITRSRILETVHEAASDLYVGGSIGERRMRSYDAICLAVPGRSGRRIRALRKRYELSQAALAWVLNTSRSTVRGWEIGEKRPTGPSLKLLDLLDRKGLEALL